MTGIVEPLEAGDPRRAGSAGGPTLWLVHALGDSSRAFSSLLTSSLSSRFELLAPDWPGAAAAPLEPHVADLEGLGAWFARTIEHHTPAVPVGLVGHSLGAAVAVKAARQLRNVAGVFSIEGNLTEADAYLSGLAATFEVPEGYRNHLLGRVRAMAEAAGSTRGEALWRYHESLTAAAPEMLWRIGRSAAAASRGDALGDEYRALSVPTLYYWSRETTPPATQDYIRRHTCPNVEFVGDHWPMIEQPHETANQVASFFQPLFAAGRRSGR
jgi:pimeloyl-ACP methyl ester carboxylesterase